MVKKLLPATLRAELERLPRLAVAFSGGLDSRFLCHAARLCACEVIALHVAGPHVPGAETAGARRAARAMAIPYREIALNVLELEEIRINSPDRCYACKSAIFASLRKLAANFADCALCDGTNADDAKAYRPGLRALQEQGVMSPLARAGLGKDELRRLARATGLPDAGQKARPCLLTRLDYGIAPNAQILQRLENAEERLGTVLPEDLDFRLRLTPEPELHLTRQPGSAEQNIRQILSATGFGQARIGIYPSLSGFFDRRRG